MRKKMPTEIKGRQVNLCTIDDEIDVADPIQSVWDALERHKEPGVWYRLRETKYWTYGAKDKVTKGLYMRIYTRGFQPFLSIRVTEEDGICFQWQGRLLDEDAYQLAAELHRKRLDKKIMLNKNVRGLTSAMQCETLQDK